MQVFGFVNVMVASIEYIAWNGPHPSRHGVVDRPVTRVEYWTGADWKDL